MAIFLPRRMRRTSGPRILLLVRDGVATTWRQLCEEFGLDSSDFHTAHNMLWGDLLAKRRGRLRLTEP
ncbi:MAG: hypothetical protein ABI988_17800, partial [Nitrospirota bacterium]